MLDNIREHSLVVTKLAQEIYNGLAASPRLPYPLPDFRLVTAGALLHDIAKTICLDESCDHAVLGAEICQESGYPEVAHIVAEHVTLSSYQPERCAQGLFTAADIVFYADKRVRHDEVVTLEERLAYILKRYGKQDPARHARIRMHFDRCREMEQYLFFWMNRQADELGAGQAENQQTLSPNPWQLPA